MTRPRRLSLLGVFIAAALFQIPTLSSQGTVTIGNYQLVSSVQTQRGTELTYRATLTNGGVDLSAATATISKAPSGSTVLDGSLTFGPVASGDNVDSTDTFTIRYKKTRPAFDPTRIVWSIAVTAINRAPTANAGPDQTAPVGAVVTLDGTGSTDPDGNTLSYSWAFDSQPSGSTASLTNPTSVRPTFQVDAPGTYVVHLVVNGGSASSTPDTVVISTVNSAPVANAGPDQTALVGQTVTLDGSASNDVDGDPLTFHWSFQSRPQGSTATLSDLSAVKPTFVLDVSGTYTLQLIVDDGTLASTSDFVTVTTGNSPPVASAGPDQSVALGATVTLDGSASTDANGDTLTYAWSLTSVPTGSTATLSDPAAVQPTFVADRAGTYVAQLMVSDASSSSAPDTVSITTENSAPTANAGSDQSANVGQAVLLSGAASSDPDGDPLTYAWSLTAPAGSTATLTSTNAVGTSFTPDVVGDYVVQLIVSDGVRSSAPDTATITTLNSTPVANAGPDQLNVPLGSLVSLDGIGSSDPDGQLLTYRWSLTTKPTGSTATLSDPTAINPTFTPDVAGDYVAQLIVNDGFVDSAPDTALIRIVRPPVANAGGDQNVTTGATVNLDGSGSTNPDGGSLTYSWTLTSVPAASAAVLTADQTATPSFVADVDGTYVVQLTVTNTAGLQDQDSVSVSASSGSSPTVTVSATDGTASETGPDAGVFTVTRSGSTAASLTVFFTLGGSATNGSDYSLVGSSVLIPSGSATAAVTVTPINDDAKEPSEDATLTLSADAAYVVGSPSNATVTIADNDTNVVSVTALQPTATEAGPTTSTFRFTRTGSLSGALAVDVSRGGSASIDDYSGTPSGTTFTVTILDGQASADVTITPVKDNKVEGDESVVLTVNASSAYTVGSPANATVTITDDPAIVSIGATDANASEAGLDTGMFTVSRSGGDVSSELAVTVSISGLATNGTDYSTIDTTIKIPATQSSTPVTVTPLKDNLVEVAESVTLTIGASSAYTIGNANAATVTIADDPPTVAVTATDPDASEIDLDPGLFTFSRTGGNMNAQLSVPFTTTGTATSGVDYAALGTSVIIPAGQATVTLTVTPNADTSAEPSETVIVTLAGGSYAVGAPSSATVTIADDPNANGILINGALMTGRIALPKEVDEWRFDATVGDRIAVHIGQIVDDNDFRPRMQLISPTGTTLGDVVGTDATAINGAVASATGTYRVLVSSYDSLLDGTGTYRLTMTHTPGPITVSPSDEGGPLTNGAMHLGTIVKGDLDTWTFTANAGERIALHIGEITDNDDFRPWIRLWAPNGTVLGDAVGVDATALNGAVAPVTGTYLVLVASYDSGFDGTGTYRLTMTKTTGAITVSTGDQGGPLENGATHTGQIIRGDLDTWTFTATAGDRIDLHIGQITDDNDFRPWIRLWAPNGTVLGDTVGTDAAVLNGAVAPVTGVYLVLVASYDSFYDGTGTYRLTMMHTPGPTVVSSGDQGGPLDNGATHTGEIIKGDLDVWTFTANQGDRIDLHIGELTDNDDFRPWIRLWAPNATVLADTVGVDAAVVNGAVAPVTGTYFVLVASYDSGYDGTGTYRLTMAHTPGPIVVTSGDQGGPLDNGATHIGEIVRGDVDVWTFTANAGERIGIQIGQITEDVDFRPWIRLWAPNGTVLVDTAGTEAAVLNGAVAPVNGTYLVLVASYDSFYDGTGTYRLTMTKTSGAITISGGDEGGPLGNASTHTGQIVTGDLDVWTFTANANDRIGVQIGQLVDDNDFRPWIRVWAPNGTVLADTAGVDAAVINGVVAPVNGQYLVLVASYDSGYDATGTYRLTMTHTPGPVEITAGDEGGALENGAMHLGTITNGDLDVWTFTANANDRIGVNIGEIVDSSTTFAPWIRLWAPNGTVLADTAGPDAAVINGAIAPVSGTYLVLVGSYNSGYNGTGTYRLTMTHTPGPITVSAGDEGGALTNGGTSNGEIVRGDLDVWAISAGNGQKITVQITQTSEADDFRPWIRLWAPNGNSKGDTAGVDTALLSQIPVNVSGTYLILVGSYDSGFNGTGTYSLTVTVQ